DQDSETPESQPIEPVSTPDVVSERATGRIHTTVQRDVEGLVTLASNFAGCFFLVNVGIGLGLYNDFLSPMEPGISLSIWDFIGIVGRDLCGAKFEEDAVWNLLAQLSGRKVSDEPGAAYEPPVDWKMPPDWLRAFSERNAWRFSSANER